MRNLVVLELFQERRKNKAIDAPTGGLDLVGETESNLQYDSSS